MSDITTPNRSTLNQGEVAQITMLITQHANVDFSKKVCDYHPSWSDDRVWRMVAVGDRKHLTVESITKFRKSFFGATPEEEKKRGEAQGNGNMSAVWRSIRDLQERVAALEASATGPRTNRMSAPAGTGRLRVVKTKVGRSPWNSAHFSGWARMSDSASTHS